MRKSRAYCCYYCCFWRNWICDVRMDWKQWKLTTCNRIPIIVRTLDSVGRTSIKYLWTCTYCVCNMRRKRKRKGKSAAHWEHCCCCVDDTQRDIKCDKRKVVRVFICVKSKGWRARQFRVWDIKRECSYVRLRVCIFCQLWDD